ncbi:MAG: cupin domain-containing protein [Desulfovibrio sp.]|nr:cupin domain-containing protein [Desulfovibrio sp.]
MIRRANELEQFDKVMFGGPGAPHFTKVLNEGEFENRGRLYNHVLLRPGDAIGVHRHNKEFEVYFILKGEAVYNDNGTEVVVRAGDMTLCPSGEEHGIRNDGPNDVEMMALILFADK